MCRASHPAVVDVVETRGELTRGMSVFDSALGLHDTAQRRRRDHGQDVFTAVQVTSSKRCAASDEKCALWRCTRIHEMFGRKPAPSGDAWYL